ncbi:MAG: cytochrome c [Anaerolineales bacterium]|nr:cytochrome c [Anaerolineales bacterium]
MTLLKQLLVVFLIVGLLFSVLLLFSMDVLKVDWITFMEIQPSFDAQEDPLPVPVRSIPVDGAASIPNMGAPVNPVAADDVSLERGGNLYGINCVMCHGVTGEGNGQIAALLANKPANLTLDITQNKSDGALFLTLTNGVTGRMPPLVENLTVRDRWDVVNYMRTLKPAQ